MANKPRDKGEGRVVIPLPIERKLSEKHLEHLRTSSGLSDETIRLACLYSEGSIGRLSDLVGRRWGNHGTAIVFPFYEPGSIDPYAYRVRPDRPRPNGKTKSGKPKFAKYDQPAGTGTYVYFPPRARARSAFTPADDAVPLELVLWVEGEKKALILDELGYTVVGLTGVWNWGAGDTENEGDRFHPLILKHVKLAARAHVILFDADAHKNVDVMKAARRFAGMLRAAGALSWDFVTPPLVDGGPKGIDDYYVAHGESAVRALIAAGGDIEPLDPKQPRTRVRGEKSMREAPASIVESARMPDAYWLEKDGALWVRSTGKDADEARPVAERPLWLTRIMSDAQTGEENVELVFRAVSGTWRTVVVSRRAIVDVRSYIAELAAIGAPGTAYTARDMIGWLAAYEEVNSEAIARGVSASHFGWHTVGDGERVFVGHRTYTASDRVDIELDARGDRRRIAETFKPRGSFDAHRDALRRAWAEDSTAAVMICAALATPLLELLDASNFAVHLEGESSRGKSTMLQIAASVYGDPRSPRWVASWNTTVVGAEVRAHTLCDLPQCYDEVGAGDVDTMQKLVYALVNGGGRTRSSKDLTPRETADWRTVVLSTGEHALADETAATGAQVRVITLPVPGFGDLEAEQVDELRRLCAANAGSVGERWLEAVVREVAADVTALREVVMGYQDELRKKVASVKGAGLRARAAGYFATLLAAEVLAHEHLGLGQEDGDTMEQAFVAYAASVNAPLPLAERSRDAVLEWRLSEPDAFPELERATDSDDAPVEPRGSGRTRHGFLRKGQTKEDPGTLLLIPSSLRAFLARNGMAIRPVLAVWRQREWTDCAPGRTDKLVKIAGRVQRLVALRLSSAEGDL